MAIFAVHVIYQDTKIRQPCYFSSQNFFGLPIFPSWLKPCLPGVKLFSISERVGIAKGHNMPTQGSHGVGENVYKDTHGNAIL